MGPILSHIDCNVSDLCFCLWFSSVKNYPEKNDVRYPATVDHKDKISCKVKMESHTFYGLDFLPILSYWICEFVLFWIILSYHSSSVEFLYVHQFGTCNFHVSCPDKFRLLRFREDWLWILNNISNTKFLWYIAKTRGKHNK